MQHQPIDDILLVAFADGELDPVTRQLVADQIAANPAMAERVMMFRSTAEMLRNALATPDPAEVPLTLMNNVTRLIDAHRPRHRLAALIAGGWQPNAETSRRWAVPKSWIPLAAAAAIAGFVLGSADVTRLMDFGSGRRAIVAHILSEVADYHGVFAAETEHLVEVPASRQAHLEAWLSERMKYKFTVPDLRAQNLSFQGGRLLAINRQPVAQLIYTGADGGTVALCIALNASDTSSPLQMREDDGLRLFGKGIGQHTFIVVGPAGNPSLRAVAEAMPVLFGHS